VTIRTGEQGVHVRAPGKINLALKVGPAGADGYHRLVSVFQAVSLYEDVHAEPAQGISVSVSGRHADEVPTDGRNLAVRAARLLSDATRVRSGVHLHLTKDVPTAGGMGGGSADAAATLLACDLLWSTGLARDELAELAAELGADVPFALTGLTAVGTGRGDVVSPALARGQFFWVLALQDRGLATPDVFAHFDARTPRPPEPEVPDQLMAALLLGDAEALAPHLVNDLEPAARELAPRLSAVVEAARGAGALTQLVSGSGPTVVALAANHAHAHEIAENLRRAAVADDVVEVTGPVPGARVLESMRGGAPGRS
jgi:4-diphosphocytidyl-2-C-methyl-D-erythritol kinase